jgi:hypothetical protein
VAARDNDESMAICPICERSFDERAYQLVVRGVGTFDSVTCVEEALRRHRRRGNGALASDLLDSIARHAEDDDGVARDQPRRLSP